METLSHGSRSPGPNPRTVKSYAVFTRGPRQRPDVCPRLRLYAEEPECYSDVTGAARAQGRGLPRCPDRESSGLKRSRNLLDRQGVGKICRSQGGHRLCRCF
jgi:hypothetical protein